MGLKDIEATLPPGFRFDPSDEELVCHYLYKKIANEGLSKGTLVEVDLHTCEPWQLPDEAKLGANEWYFFSTRERKYATGFRTNRATASGYWKATGKDRPVFHLTTNDTVAGMRKTLVFYRDRAPNGIRTGWIMHEFRLEMPYCPLKEDWVLCRVFYKNKGELTNELTLENEFDTINIGVSSPPTDQKFISFSSQTLPQYEESYDPSTLPTSLAALNHNVFELPHELNNSPINVFNPRSGDEYGFLLDMNLDD